MAAFTVQVIDSPHGGELQNATFTQASASDTWTNTGNELVIIDNGHSGPLDSVFVSVANEYGRTGDLTVTTTNARISVAGPFPPHLWNSAAGLCTITHADFTLMTVAVVRFSKV